MKVNIDKKKLLSLIEKYYRETKGLEGKATARATKELTGYGTGEHEDCVVYITFSYTKNIQGVDFPSNIAIEEDKVKEIIKYFMEKENLNVNYVEMNSGLTQHTSGYGLGEETSYIPYFKGVEVSVTEKENDKSIKNLKLYKGCLIVVDMVNGFVNEGVLHDKEIGRIIPRQIELIKAAKNEGKVIVFIKDTHSKDSVEFERFGDLPHCLKGKAESELVKELKSFEKDEDTISVEKNSTSFMEAPDFRKFMLEQLLLEDFDIVGCCTDICVVNGAIGLANYLDQHNIHHTIRVHEDAIATYAESDRQNYVEAAKLLMKQQGIQLVKKMDN